MKLRRFNADGVSAFGAFLSKCRLEPDAELPIGMLENRSLTEVVEPEVQVAPSHFETKGDVARYLSQVLKPLRSEEVAKDPGLWTWLTLFYFDSVCPSVGGKRVVKNDYHYIFEPNNPRHFYRHLLYLSWRVITLAPSHNRLFLRSRLVTLDKVTTEVMKRLYLTRVPCIFEVLERLYWDHSRNRPKPGITGADVKPGDLTHRFPLRIRQLEMTYDLMSLTADQLIELLGEEFAFAGPKPKALFQE